MRLTMVWTAIAAMFGLMACGHGFSEGVQAHFEDCVDQNPDSEQWKEWCLEDAEASEKATQRYDEVLRQALDHSSRYGPTDSGYNKCLSDVGSGRIERMVCREITYTGRGSDGSRYSAAPIDTATANFVAGIKATKVMNPATLRVFVKVSNQGDAVGVPICTINARDPSFNYTGVDVWTLDRLKPGGSYVHYGDITIEEEGATFVTRTKVECKVD